MVGLALIADLHDGATYAASVIPVLCQDLREDAGDRAELPDVLNPAIRQRHAVPAHHVAVSVRLSKMSSLSPNSQSRPKQSPKSPNVTLRTKKIYVHMMHWANTFPPFWRFCVRVNGSDRSTKACPCRLQV